MNAEEARAELVRVLELDAEASWSDVVHYTAKAKDSARMSNATIARRSVQLAAALGLPDGTSWPEALRRVRSGS